MDDSDAVQILAAVLLFEATLLKDIDSPFAESEHPR